jgi:putative PIN family toxin of toxin-antitoxin system
MTTPERVVFDCNVFFQAVISKIGPAHRLFSLVIEGRVTLYASAYVIGELTSLTSDPRIKKKYRLTQSSLDEFFAMIHKHAMFVDIVPHVFDFPRDPDDAHYVDLALAAGAKLIVSRDKDLLSLRDAATAEGKDFLSRYPALSILTPPEALKLIEATPLPE